MTGCITVFIFFTNRYKLEFPILIEFEHLIREGKREIEGMGNDNTSSIDL